MRRTNQIAHETMWDVFLCHNSQDRTAVEELERRLAERGVKAWLDKWDLPPSRPWLP
ncbi:MAG: TIR domain-containing protein [Pirellulaceae bacterium]|nr:TIR domain-containing protein [Pirellulaceae bacterium]